MRLAIGLTIIFLLVAVGAIVIVLLLVALADRRKPSRYKYTGTYEKSPYDLVYQPGTDDTKKVVEIPEWRTNEKM